MWILILTLVSPTVQGGNSIASVPGFTSEQTCLVAAKHWVREKPVPSAKESAICVKV